MEAKPQWHCNVCFTTTGATYDLCYLCGQRRLAPAQPWPPPPVFVPPAPAPVLVPPVQPMQPVHRIGPEPPDDPMQPVQRNGSEPPDDYHPPELVAKAKANYELFNGCPPGTTTSVHGIGLTCSSTCNARTAIKSVHARVACLLTIFLALFWRVLTRARARISALFTGSVKYAAAPLA